MNKITTTILCLALSLAMQGQTVRTMHYFPDGRDIVCLNGENRYTRALYGTNTRFRLETSDRPVFAAYDRAESSNLGFFAVYDGKELNLDSTEWCESRYGRGRRSYVLKDSSWGDGRLEIVALASFFSESAIFQFKAEGFDKALALKVRRGPMTDTKMTRDGELGIDPREKFELSPDCKEPEIIEWNGNGETYCLLKDKKELSVLDAAQGAPLFAKETDAFDELTSRVEFNTPDPFINTIGGNLVASADGMWDGTTWLHGCVGWRTPLAGWRGGYVGDAVGWSGRSRSHFIAYANSMVTDVPPVIPFTQDPNTNLASGLHQWGTQMYSNGYISKLPNRTDQISHYDMNLNYMDELLWHFSYDADTAFMKQMWPYIKLHLEWEKRNWDPDNDHLYDAYCDIWASDALYYDSGAVTHSSAYNYRGNKLAARIAEIIGEDPAPYKAEADAILAAMNERLWMDDMGYWAEFQDFMGHKRLHKSAALWTIYTPIDCEACTPEQAYRATLYVDECIPHIPVLFDYDKEAVAGLGLKLPEIKEKYYTVSSSNWMPYVWSTNNVAHEEVTNMALAYLQAGRNDSGYKLLKSDILDEMYLGLCPGNFGQISFYDKSRNEAYRDFGDNVGITSRALINGLFGILPNALYGECILSPAFPDDWNEASVKTPYLSYSFRREGNSDIYEVEQNFNSPLQIVFRANAGGGAYLEVRGTSEKKQTIVIDRSKLPVPKTWAKADYGRPDVSSRKYLKKMGLLDIRRAGRKRMVDMSAFFNSNVDDIFRNEYLSPRSPYVTASIPKQGIGDWCSPRHTREIQDDGFRATLKDGVFDTGLGVRFLSPAEGHNIAYTSLWDNYPDEITIPLEGRARNAYLLMAGSTNSMQSRIENGTVTVTYKDGSKDVMSLENPINWCSIEQDYYTDEYAFKTADLHPYRVLLNSGQVSRNVSVDFIALPENDMNNVLDTVKDTDRGIPDGAAQILKMPLRRGKKLQSITVSTLSNNVVIGLMAVTLEK